jgi:hypothetical protein
MLSVVVLSVNMLSVVIRMSIMLNFVVLHSIKLGCLSPLAFTNQSNVQKQALSQPEWDQRLARDKRSSLLVGSVSRKKKSFITFTPRANVIKLFVCDIQIFVIS